MAAEKMTGEWLAVALETMMTRAPEKLSGRDALRFTWLRTKGADDWTERERFEVHTKLERYKAVLKMLGVRWQRVGQMEMAAADEEPIRETGTRHVSAREGSFLIRFEYQDLEAGAAVRAIAGARYTGRGFWSVEGSVGAREGVRGLGTIGFALDEQADALCDEIRVNAETLRVASRAVVAGGEMLPGMRPYQVAGATYMALVKKGFLADDMGLGKTLQALATVEHLQAWPCLCVTLAKIKDGWRSECERWLPGVRVRVWEGTTPEKPEKDAEARTLHVVNYDIVKDRVDELAALKVKGLIIDEIHLLRNGKAARTKAVQRLARRVPVRLGLTGTPVLNNPGELLAQLTVLGRLKDFGGFWYFVERYCDAKQVTHSREATHWDMTGASNLGELHEKLRSICYLRRTKEQVLPELPPQIVTRVPVGMDAAGAMEYERAAADLRTWLLERAASRVVESEERPEDLAARITEAIERVDGMELLLRMTTLGELAARGKVGPVADWVKEYFFRENKLLLFGHHRSVMREGLLPRLGAHGLLPVIIDGKTSETQRAAAMERFAKDPKTRVMLLNLAAGGTGMDGLQHAASHVAYIEWPWTPASLEQATSRLHRMGQRDCVNRWDLIAPATVDVERLAVLANKAKVCDGVTDGAKKAELAVAAARDVARGLFTTKR